jgi:phosphopantothenoylcysteine synthetase/decarboxylase
MSKKGGVIISVNGKKRRYTSIHMARKFTYQRVAEAQRKSKAPPVIEIYLD